MLDDGAVSLVRAALAEDAADEDITTLGIVAADALGRARLVTREACVVAGLDVFEACFTMLDADVTVTRHHEDGSLVETDAVVADVTGRLRPILSAERTALNFVQRLSGVATLTRLCVQHAPGVEVRDTRKTTPGMRALEKAAVRAGGGTNHRPDLRSALLIKDNHIAAAGSLPEAVRRAREAYPDVHLEVECESMEQVEQALAAGADELLLDNMDLDMLAKAVKLAEGRARTEASGGITLDVLEDVAASGVDAISLGALTHSAPAVDLSLEVEQT